MESNIIDGTDRFRQAQKPGTGTHSILDAMREKPRVAARDRLTLAKRLGELAAKIDPEHPDRPAKRWFERWDGDRWQKRRKFICFPDEESRDPNLPGLVAANSGDWVALINAAVEDRFTAKGLVADRDRENLKRNLLRGTEYLPEFEQLHDSEPDAQHLLLSISDKICGRMAKVEGLTRLWQALQTTPFTIEDAGRGKFEIIRYQDEELEIASRAANEISDDVPWCRNLRYDKDDLLQFCGIGIVHDIDLNNKEYSYYDYENDVAWSYPKIRIGLFGFRVNTRIFSVPSEFYKEIPNCTERNPFVAEWILEWLYIKGILNIDDCDTIGGKFCNNWPLPDVSFDPERGYGWKAFSYDILREVWLECRPRQDGSVGLWVSIARNDGSYDHCYPILDHFDCLAGEAVAPPVYSNHLPFWWSEEGGYMIAHWPHNDPIFSPPPAEAVIGLVDLDPIEMDQFSFEGEAPEMAGWLDDLDNRELQELLFRTPDRARFLPSVEINDNAPPACRPGTIANTLLANLACLPEERIVTRIVDASERIAAAGLTFHDALVSHYRRLVDDMDI